MTGSEEDLRFSIKIKLIFQMQMYVLLKALGP